MRFFFLLTFLLSGCAVHTGVVEISNNTYMVSRQAATGFTGRGNLKEESLSEAHLFCKNKSKSLKVISIQEAQPPYILGNFPKAEVQFVCEENEKNTKNIASAIPDSKPETTSINKEYRLDLNNIRANKSDRDAVAIVIGIKNYKRLAKADYADQDATKFAEYAHRALNIPKGKIKVLTDTDADQAAFLKTFRNWLPLNVNKGRTEVFVFYSGHGLPSSDGKSLYFLPHGVDQDLLDETAIDQKKIVTAIQSAQPKSVTMFIDSCYSGQSRSGSQLLTAAKPVRLKNPDIGYPPEFIVLTASAADQISSASNDLEHGIFSFYLMKGMEGDADANKDGKITFGEMQQYLSENVQRQALETNRVQVPQLIGNANQVLVGR
jgi:hypothetical protein